MSAFFVKNGNAEDFEHERNYSPYQIKKYIAYNFPMRYDDPIIFQSKPS